MGCWKQCVFLVLLSNQCERTGKEGLRASITLCNTLTSQCAHVTKCYTQHTYTCTHRPPRFCLTGWEKDGVCVFVSAAVRCSYHPAEEAGQISVLVAKTWTTYGTDSTHFNTQTHTHSRRHPVLKGLAAVLKPSDSQSGDR